MKKTRAKLGISIVTILLTVLMFLGSTFAWFTDSVSNTGNKIQAGTLDVDLQLKKDTGYVSIDGDADPVFDYEKWEPGYSDAKVFKVVNSGNLAFKYELQINLANGELELNSEGHSLADVIDVYFVESTSDITIPDSFADVKTSLTKVGTLADVVNSNDAFARGILLPENGNGEVPSKYTSIAKEKETYVAVVLHMQEEAGNEYQGMQVGANFDIKLLATQVEYEKDCFDSNTYDEQAELPIKAETKYVQGQATILELFTENNKLTAKAVIPKAADIPTDTEKIVMEVTDVEKPTAVTIEEDQTSINVDISFYAVKSNGTKTQITDFGDGNIVSVDLSTILTDGYELVKVYNTHDPENPTEFTKADSKTGLTEGNFFYDSSTKTMYLASSKYSPFTFVIQPLSYEVIITKDGDSTFTPVGMSLVEFRDDVNSGTSDYGDYEGYTATLQKDINLTGVSWEPIGYYYEYYSYDYSTWTSTTIDDEYNPFCGTFDGGEHTISKLTLTDPSWLGEATKDNSNYEDFYLGLFGCTYGGEIKNLTIKDSTLVANGYGPYGFLVAMANGTDITNCHIVNSNYSGVGMGGLIADYLYYGTMDGCSTDDDSKLTITGGSYASGLVAYGYKAEIKNSTNNADITGSKSTTGIVGNCNQTNVTNCVNNGKIHSTGASDNDSFVGGIAGTVSSGNVSYCINNGVVSTEGSNSPASGIVGQNCSGNVSNVYCCINTGNISGAYASSMAAGLYGSTPVKNCYNSGTISGVKGTAGISQPVYSGACNSENCINAGSISSGTKYLSTGTNTNSYYYSGSTLKNASNEDVNDIDSVVSSLNTGLETPFWGKDTSGAIKPLALIAE